MWPPSPPAYSPFSPLPAGDSLLDSKSLWLNEGMKKKKSINDWSTIEYYPRATGMTSRRMDYSTCDSLDIWTTNGSTVWAKMLGFLMKKGIWWSALVTDADVKLQREQQKHVPQGTSGWVQWVIFDWNQHISSECLTPPLQKKLKKILNHTTQMI